jgi:aspartate racemase
MRGPRFLSTFPRRAQAAAPLPDLPIPLPLYLPPSGVPADAVTALNGAPDPDERAAIGVLGGLGPYAGLDLVREIFDQTAAGRDQEHLPVTLISYPGRIPDRSTWLADHSAPSPVPAMLEILRRLDDAGCAVAGIPCNTAHAPALYDTLAAGLRAEGRAIRLIHIVDAIVEHVREVAPGVERVGVLATDASLEARLHEIGLEEAGMDAIAPDPDLQSRLVQPSIFDAEWGLKAHSNPPSERARAALLEATEHLARRGAGAVVLGCTELPLAVPEEAHAGAVLVNSTRALARALIRATHPEKLRT